MEYYVKSNEIWELSLYLNNKVKYIPEISEPGVYYVDFTGYMVSNINKLEPDVNSGRYNSFRNAYKYLSTNNIEMKADYAQVKDYFLEMLKKINLIGNGLKQNTWRKEILLGSLFWNIQMVQLTI
jgi:hypothetical protein